MKAAKASRRPQASAKPKTKVLPRTPRTLDRRAAPSPAGPKTPVVSPRAALRSSALEAVALDAAGAHSGVQALQDKLDALGRVEEALRAQLGNSPAEDVRINANIDSLTSEQHVVEARIAAAQDGSLPPPGEGDVAALQDAIKAADDVIAQNAAVNRLIEAATALIGTLHS